MGFLFRLARCVGDDLVTSACEIPSHRKMGMQFEDFNIRRLIILRVGK